MALKGKISDYQEFVAELNANLDEWLKTPRGEWEAFAVKSVNGLASEEVRRLVSLDNRRQNGIFFTDSKLANRVLRGLQPVFTKQSKIYDPACGAGNLLISVADYLRSESQMLMNEGSFMGTDIHKPFLEAARLRFLINELLFSPDCKSDKIKKKDARFVVKQCDGLFHNEFYQKATHIFTNPPFNLVQTKEKLDWSQGQVSAAALFMDKIVQYVNTGTSIYAILPDVLRSGTRYEKWRRHITKQCVVERIELLGQFDKYADVDVFSIHLTKKSRQFKVGKSTFEKAKINTDAKVVEDTFNVCVGPVVDNRDEKIGPVRNFVVSKGLEGWTTQTRFNLLRSHSGKSFKSPFIVIKRTSRMGDAQRAIATIINSKRNVYVDNHLIVLQPKSGTLNDCKKMLENLKKIETDNWINNRSFDYLHFY